MVWVPLSETLDLALASPTRFMLKLMMDRGSDPAQFEHLHPTPLFTKIDGRREVIWDPA